MRLIFIKSKDNGIIKIAKKMTVGSTHDLSEDTPGHIKEAPRLVFFKAKRYEVGETSEKTGRKKVAPGKWTDVKNGKKPSKPEDVKSAVKKSIESIRAKNGGAGAEQAKQAAAGIVEGEEPEQAAKQVEQAGKTLKQKAILKKEEKNKGKEDKKEKMKDTKMSIVEKRKYKQLKESYHAAKKKNNSHAAKELMMQIDDIEKKNKKRFSDRENMRKSIFGFIKDNIKKLIFNK